MESGHCAKTGDQVFVFTLGSASENDIVLDNPEVSDFHGVLIVENGKITLKERDNKNRIFVNGERIKHKSVTDADEILIGSHCFRLADYLPAQFDPRILEQKKLEQSQVIIGRYENNDFVLCYPQISNIHARLFREYYKWYIEDLGSTNGTYVNDRNVRIRKKEITPEDQLYFGSYGIAAFRIMKATKEKSVFGMHVTGDIAVLDKPLVIGRDPACDFPLESPTISWHHAWMQKVGNEYVIEDTGSSNGTFVNGQRIRRKVISASDIIALGTYNIGIDENGCIIKRDFRGDIRLDVEDVTVVDDRSQPILDKITFSVYPSEFVGLMGPSGAGKTTLLTAINGYNLPHNGVVKINGQNLYANYNNFRRVIGYVPQDDIIHRELTVYEALRYTAKLRFSKDVDDKEIDSRIDQVLTSLGIIKCRNKRIGSPENRGISGGERKRVNLAMELLTDPSLLFLDEPTSGLSSADTVTVMDVLQKLAREGKTIILTIHQPSLEVYQKMNNVIILKSGVLAYYGPACPDAMTFFNPNMPKKEAACRVENVLDGLMKESAPRAWHDAYLKSPYYLDYVIGRRESKIIVDGKERIKGNEIVSQPFRQWWILLQRYFTIKKSDLVGMMILLAQAPIIAGLIANVFHGEPEMDVPLYFLVVAALWFGTSNAAKEIVCEKAIYTRERMVNLKILPYVMSKFIGLSLLCLIQCAVMILIFVNFLDIQADLLRLFGLTILASLVGLSAGLALSAIVKTTEAAIALVPLVLLPMIILGGLISPIANMAPSTRVISMLMPSRWAFEGLLHAEGEKAESRIIGTDKEKFWDAEDKGNLILYCPTCNQVTNNPFMRDFVLRYFGDYRSRPSTDTSALLCFVLVFLSLSFISLKVKDKT